MTMPVPPVTSPGPSPAPAEPGMRASGGTAPTQARAFSSVLSQQQTQGIAGRRIPSDAKSAGRDTDKTSAPQGPDATLTLILDSAALPLMQTLVVNPPVAVTTQGTPATRVQADAALAAPTAGILLTVSANANATVQPAQGAGSPVRQPAATTREPAPRTDAQALALAENATSADPAAADARNRTTASGSQPTTLNAQSTAAAAWLTTAAARAQPAVASTQPHPDHAPSAPVPDAPALLAALAGSAAPAAQAAPALLPVATLAVPSPLGSPQWIQDFTRQIVSYAQSGANGIHTVQLHVNPPELGPVHILLQISDASTQATFMSPHLQVRQTLENALPGLAQQFAQAGLSLGQANVSDQQAGQQGFFGQSAPGGTSTHAGSSFSLASSAPSATSFLPDAAQSRASTLRPDTLVDTFV